VIGNSSCGYVVFRYEMNRNTQPHFLTFFEYERTLTMASHASHPYLLAAICGAVCGERDCGEYFMEWGDGCSVEHGRKLGGGNRASGDGCGGV
jgi:hypothetical protein